MKFAFIFTMLRLLVFLSFTLFAFAGCPFANVHKNLDKDDLREIIDSVFHHEQLEVVDVPDPLEVMNLQLQENYKITKNKILKQDTDKYPLLIVNTQNLYFYQNDTYIIHPILPELYTNLKLVCHVALGSFVLLEGVINDGGIVTAIAEQAISEYLAVFPSAIASLGDRNLSQIQLDRADLIIDNSQNILETTLNTGTVNTSQVQTYARALTPSLAANIADAAYAQLNMLNTVVQPILNNMTTEEQDNFRVVVLGSHMARHGGEIMQYFCKLLDTEPTSGKRVVFAEGLDIAGAVNLQATHLIDFTAGEAFWGSPEHMHWDILASATHLILPTLLEKE